MVDPAVPCGRCAVCLAGSAAPLPRAALRRATARPTARCARCMAWPERLALPAPRLAPGRRGGLLEPLGVALHALDLGHVGPGTTAACSAAGRSGCCSSRRFATVGATAIVSPPTRSRTGSPRRPRWERREGRTSTRSRRRLERLPRPARVSTSPSRRRARTRRSRTRRRRRGPAGRVVIVGIPDGDRTSFTASTARRKGLTLLLCRRMEPADLPRAIRLVEAGRVELGAARERALRSLRVRARRSPRSSSGAGSRSSSSRNA